MKMTYNRSRLGTDSGIALISVLLALALVGTLGAALATVGTVEYQTSVNHRSATRALLAADAGASHAVALLRGALDEYTYTDILLGDDGLPETADDGLLAGFDLAEADALPDTGVVLGKGRYFVRIENDDVDPSGDAYVDDNYRLLARCRGETEDGGVAEVHVILASPAFPAIVSNGDLHLPGNPEVLGPCAGVHANRVLTADGVPVVDGSVSATDTVILSGTITDGTGAPVTPKSDQPPIEVPEYGVEDFCDDPDYILRDGWVVSTGPPRDSAFAGGQRVAGWKWDADGNVYTLAGKKAEPGVVCADGNVEIGGNIGSEGDPFEITVLAEGSVKVTGNPKITSAHPDRVLVLAEGDVQIGGVASGITPNYAGLVYAGSQCKINGTPAVQGHILCQDATDPPGATDLTDENIVNGDPRVTYDCTGVRRPTLVATWWESRAR